MRRSGYVRAGVLVVIVGICSAWMISPSVAEEGQPAAKKAAKKPYVMGYYNQLELSESQREQVSAIQAEYSKKIREIRAEEQAKIAAVLTPEQQDQLKQIQSKPKARPAAKVADKPAKPAKTDNVHEHHEH